MIIRGRLQYAARLRLGKGYSSQQQKDRVEEVIDVLGLRNAANVLVGSETQRGISGGEKRRLSLALESTPFNAGTSRSSLMRIMHAQC